MKKALILLIIIICNTVGFKSFAQDAPPDTVYTGIYITSIHDIDFRQKEYTVNLWLWLKYKNKEFDFLQNLEIPQAKSVTKSFSTVDTTGNRIYILMKLQCVMKDSWEISHFPFDKQKLKLSLENSQFDSGSLIFKDAARGKHYDPEFTISGWTINNFNTSSKIKIYESDFGDDTIGKPHSEYSSFNVDVGLERKAIDLFWKMFLGMYVAFLIAFIGFFIHANSVESRFGLSVGSIFAVVGNKYIIDSVLPESSTFTLVDTLHGITLFYIFLIVTSTAYSLYLIKKDTIQKVIKFDKIFSFIIFTTYLALNIYFISKAVE